MILKIKSLQKILIRTSCGLLQIEEDYETGLRILVHGTEVYKQPHMKGKKLKKSKKGDSLIVEQNSEAGK